MVFPLDEPAGNEFDDAAYNMAAVTATIALYRALVKKGVLAREEARQILLDEAISRSIEGEALRQGPGMSKTTMEINDVFGASDQGRRPAAPSDICRDETAVRP